MLEAARNVANPGYQGVLFRRTTPELRNPGGLWDRSQEIYPALGGVPREQLLDWRFPSGAKIKMSHLQYESDIFSWQGAEAAFLGFDELTHFLEKQFWFLVMARGRSTCGVRPYARGTCNPDPNSWVKRLIAPWLDRKRDDYARSGELRWFIRDADTGVLRWVPKGAPDAVSLTFVRADVFDNKILLAKNPEYLAKLRALPRVDRLRLLEGDWDAVDTDGGLFKRRWFRLERGKSWRDFGDDWRWIRSWDFAATEAGGDWTVGTLFGRSRDGAVCIADVRRDRVSPLGVEAMAKRAAADDGLGVEILLEQEPGSSGVAVTDRFVRDVLAGLAVRVRRSTGSKIERAKPVSALAEQGHVTLLDGEWNDAFLTEAELFGRKGCPDDQIDTVARALQYLCETPDGLFLWGTGGGEAAVVGDDLEDDGFDDDDF